MKKLFFVMAACAAICACNTKEDIVKPNIDDQFSGDAAYLTVNIKNADAQTRAESGGFAYGSEAEQVVGNAYFYFYDDNGAYITYGSLGSVSGTATTDPTDGNIEWGSNTVVAVYGLSEGNFPTKMVTVLNQPADFVGMSKSLDEMTAALAEAADGWADESDNFVMSTSVYSSNGVVNYTALTADDFAAEPINVETDYPDGGVDVYVERLAAKVGVRLTGSMGDGGTGTLSQVSGGINGYTAYDFSGLIENELVDAEGTPVENPSVYVAILGFDIDATARDSYMLKDISGNANWSGLTFVWNGPTNNRCYWAESPNYGVETDYPTSSLGHTDEDEDTEPLNEYLKYTSFENPIALGSYAYCGENTNTVGEDGVLKDGSSTAITNAIIKAQAYTYEDGSYVPLDLVEYHGMYYTAADFCQKCVDDVVAYDFTVLVDDAIAALEEKYKDLADYLELLDEAVIHDHIYCTAVDDTNPTSVTAFDGGMLSLYNAYDGNVKIFYNDAQPYWGEDGTGEAVEPALYNSYKEEDIVYGGTKLGDYNYWFHVDEDILGSGPTWAMWFAGLLKQIDGEYYMPLDNSISITTQAGHVYTMRNYLLRAITEECEEINTRFGSIYPNYFKDGLMYYHTPIEHLGNTGAEGEYGVVRNHWYDITVTYFSKLGRGIAVEDEVIVPQPELDYYYLGADVNILSWQMISQSVGF